MSKKIFVLDTNVLLTDSNSILNFDDGDIAIPLKVLDEIDKHKKRQDSVGVHARNTIRKLDELRSQGNLFEGVELEGNKVFVKGFDPFKLPDDLDVENPDNQIIATALSLKEDNKKSKVIMVSTVKMTIRSQLGRNSLICIPSTKAPGIESSDVTRVA